MCDYSDLNPKFKICVFDFGTTQVLSYSHHWQGLRDEIIQPAPTLCFASTRIINPR